MTASGERPATGETVRRVAAARAGRLYGPVVERPHWTDAEVARALEAAAKCSGCDGRGVLRFLPAEGRDDIPCPGGADGARCERGLDPARLDAGLKRLEEG